MLSLLLDENISPEVAAQIHQKRPDIRIISIHMWQDGLFMAEPDELILTDAAALGLTLVTYDQKTIMPVLVQWGYVGTDHAGVIFIDDLSIATHDFGSIIRSLIALWDASHQEDWTNIITYLRPEE
jgi:hypothetical protein